MSKKTQDLNNLNQNNEFDSSNVKRTEKIVKKPFDVLNKATKDEFSSIKEGVDYYKRETQIEGVSQEYKDTVNQIKDFQQETSPQAIRDNEIYKNYEDERTAIHLKTSEQTSDSLRESHISMHESKENLEVQGLKTSTEDSLRNPTSLTNNSLRSSLYEDTTGYGENDYNKLSLENHDNSHLKIGIQDGRREQIDSSHFGLKTSFDSQSNKKQDGPKTELHEKTNSSTQSPIGQGRLSTSLNENNVEVEGTIIGNVNKVQLQNEETLSELGQESVYGTQSNNPNETIGSLSTNVDGSQQSILIIDEMGNEVELKVGDAILLSNGSIIGMDIDDNGDLIVFTNFFNNDNVAGSGNVLDKNSDGFVANGMTLKTSILEDVNSLNVSDIIGSDGQRIITVDMSENQAGINALATSIKGNNLSDDLKLNMNGEQATKMKLKTGGYIGAVLIVRGATFAMNKLVSLSSLLVEGMGTDKAEAEFAVEKLTGILDGKAKKGVNKASKPIAKTAFKQSRRIIAKLNAKTHATNILKKIMMKTKPTASLYKMGSAVVSKFKVFGKTMGRFGKVFKFFIKKLKKYAVIVVAILLITGGMALAAGSIINGITSVFGFLFPTDQKEELYSNFANYITEINDIVSGYNNQFLSNENHVLPLHNVSIKESDVNKQLGGKDYAHLSGDVTKKTSSVYQTSNQGMYEYGKDYLTIDSQGNPVIQQSIQDDSIFSGELNGVNWKAFLSCTQVYSGLSEKMTTSNGAEINETSFESFNVKNPRPYGQFKNTWSNLNIANSKRFVDPFVTVSVKAYYTDGKTKKDNDIQNNNDVGDKWYTTQLNKREGYFKHKEILNKYNEEYKKYQDDQIEWIKRRDIIKTKKYYQMLYEQYLTLNNQTWLTKYNTYEKYYNDVMAGKIEGPKVEKPAKPTCNDTKHKATYNQMVEEQAKPPVETITHHYKMTFQLADRSDHSLPIYQDWFKYNMYQDNPDGSTALRILTENEQEMLDMLYQSDSIFSQFDENIQTILQKAPGGLIDPLDVVVTGDSEIGVKIAQNAADKGGARYWWGASGPRFFDCSGLVYYCYNQAGVNIERSTANVYGHSGIEVKRNDLQAGDVISIGSSHSNYTHIGIYAGNGQVIHAGGGDSSTHGDNPRACVKVTTLERFIGEKGRPCHAFRRLY